MQLRSRAKLAKLFFLFFLCALGVKAEKVFSPTTLLMEGGSDHGGLDLRLEGADVPL